MSALKLLAAGHGLLHQYGISVAETETTVYAGSLREHPFFSAPVSPVFPAGETSPKNKKMDGVAFHSSYCAFANMRILKSRIQLTIGLFAAVNHLNGPLRKENFTLTGSKGHGF